MPTTFGSLVNRAVASLDSQTSRAEGRMRDLLRDELKRCNFNAVFAEQAFKAAISSGDSEVALNGNVKHLIYVQYTPTGQTISYPVTPVAWADIEYLRGNHGTGQTGTLDRCAWLYNALHVWPKAILSGTINGAYAIHPEWDDSGVPFAADAETQTNVWLQEAEAYLFNQVLARYHSTHTRDWESVRAARELAGQERSAIVEAYYDRNPTGTQAESQLASPDSLMRARRSYFDAVLHSS